MSYAIGSSRESNPSRRICRLRAVLLGHVADYVVNNFYLSAINTFHRSSYNTQLFRSRTRPTSSSIWIQAKVSRSSYTAALSDRLDLVSNHKSGNSQVSVQKNKCKKSPNIVLVGETRLTSPSDVWTPAYCMFYVYNLVKLVLYCFCLPVQQKWETSNFRLRLTLADGRIFLFPRSRSFCS